MGWFGVWFAYLLGEYGVFFSCEEEESAIQLEEGVFFLCGQGSTNKTVNSNMAYKVIPLKSFGRKVNLSIDRCRGVNGSASVHVHGGPGPGFVNEKMGLNLEPISWFRNEPRIRRNITSTVHGTGPSKVENDLEKKFS